MKTVFFDVDTQLDFVFPAGALPVPGAEEIVPRLLELTRFAAANSIQIISTADAHTENDPEFSSWKPHCVAGTTGQTKVFGTFLPQSLIVPNAPMNTANLEANAPITAQFIIEKQNIDCFTNQNLSSLLQILNAQRYLVYGVVTEVCVQKALFGLLKTGARVELVTDAVKSISQSAADRVLAEFQAAGGFLTTVSEVLSGSAVNTQQVLSSR